MVSTDYVPKTKDRMNSVLGSRGLPTKRNPRCSPWLSGGSVLHPWRLRTAQALGVQRQRPAQVARLAEAPGSADMCRWMLTTRLASTTHPQGSPRLA